MKVVKLGKVFDPTKHNLSFDCTNYAQSPQVLVFDDFIRVYFATRVSDASGKFLSKIRFVDFDPEFKKILNYSKKEVIPLGALGTFDEHGIFPFNPLKIKDQIVAYTCGWSRRSSVSVETSTGFARSNDQGETFNKLGDGPVLTSSLHEPMLVGDSFVNFFEGQYHMWYMFGKKWIEETNDEPPARVYKIAHAVSDDGIDWKKEEAVQIINDVLGEDECQALPSVVFKNGIYHMAFCYRHATDFRNNSARSYRIGYAHSTDLINWKRLNEVEGLEVSDQGWDAEMMCYPHLFEVKNEIFMLYNGNTFGQEGFGLAKLEFENE